MKGPTLSSSLCFGSPPGVCAFRNSIAYAAASSGSSVTTLVCAEICVHWSLQMAENPFITCM